MNSWFWTKQICLSRHWQPYGWLYDCRSSSIVTRKQNKTPLYITNSVQEEVGLRGAEMITKTIKPNVAIVTDVCMTLLLQWSKRKLKEIKLKVRCNLRACCWIIWELILNRYGKWNSVPKTGFVLRVRIPMLLHKWWRCFGFDILAAVAYAYHGWNGASWWRWKRD
jgi:hypothetical protein